MKRMLWPRLSVVLTVFLAHTLGLADGGFFKHKSLQEDPPTIPHQRAIVYFKDGFETLIVESTLNGSKGEYGWVIPLPSVPSEVKEVSPDGIAQVFDRFAPKPRPLDEPNFPLTGILCAILAAAGLSTAWRYRNAKNGWRVFWTVLELPLLGIFFLCAMTGGIGGCASSDVSSAGAVTDFGFIGSYEVKVLESTDGMAAAEWLASEGFETPEAALATIKAYAREGWCFMAAKIRHDVDGALPPHPLSARFRTDEAVYPMRLTAHSTPKLRLELVVVGDSRAEIDHMEVWRSSEYHHADWPASGEAPGIAAPWNTSVLTYLRADLDPGQMKQDYRVAWVPRRDYVAEVRDRKEAEMEVYRQGMLYFAAISIGAGGLCSIFGAAPRLSFWLTLLVSLAGAYYFSNTWLKSVEVVDASEVIYAPPL